MGGRNHVYHVYLYFTRKSSFPLRNKCDIVKRLFYRLPPKRHLKGIVITHMDVIFTANWGNMNVTLTANVDALTKRRCMHLNKHLFQRMLVQTGRFLLSEYELSRSFPSLICDIFFQFRKRFVGVRPLT